MAVLDHIVVVAASLDQGLDYCEALLGIRPPKGGEHERMGTHNHLLNLGGDIYLEVISINPSANAPKRPRWFGLDSSEQQARAAAEPFLATFVARTNGLVTAAKAFPSVGSTQEMTRGELRWQITIPDDGLLVENGTVPALIEWPDGIEPARSMPDFGFRLLTLTACHPHPQALRRTWDAIQLDDDRLSIHGIDKGEVPYLVAELATPTGTKIISGKV